MQGHIISHYRLVCKLGSGGFGEVWEGVHQEIDAIRVAVKVLHPALSGDQSFIENLKRECVTLHALQHPNIVGFRELVLSGDRPAMVMELVDGEDAFDAVQKGPLSPERVLEIGRDALKGLAFAHKKGVVHRDIKPSNLFLCADGTTKLLDFGIAKAADGSNATKTGTIQGTLQYMAPELFDGQKATVQSDIYALGLTLWELLSGTAACAEGSLVNQLSWHVGKGFRSIDTTTVPAALHGFFFKGCAQQPGARYASAEAALSAWNTIDLSARPVNAGSSSVMPPSTVSLDLARLNTGVKPSPAAQSLPPQSVVLSASEVEKRLDRSGAEGLPPQSVVLSASEVEGHLERSSTSASIGESKQNVTSDVSSVTSDLTSSDSVFSGDVSGRDSSSGGSRTGLFAVGFCLIVFVGGYFGYQSIVQSGLSSRVELLRAEAEIFGLELPVGPYDESAVSSFETRVIVQSGFSSRVELLRSEAESFGLELPVGPYAEAGVSSFELRVYEKRARAEAVLGQIKSVSVSGGRFMMGCVPGDGDCYDMEKPRHEVMISHDMEVMTTEVTQGLYESVMGSNPSEFKGDDRPVEEVSWYDAVNFANKLSEELGLSVCYSVDGTDVTWSNAYCNGWRLPTEAEWEYLARGGEEHIYSGSNNVGAVAWYGEDYSTGLTHPVGQKASNAFGLFDMSGNVFEWTWDLYGDYSSTSVTDPRGPSSGSGRVRRGGSWRYAAGLARSSRRGNLDPSRSSSTLGFRFLRKK